MSLLAKWIDTLSRRGRRRRRAAPPRTVRHRPTLEALETRNLLSTLVVTNLGDTGASGDGSLRGEIAAARSGDQIVFAPGLAGKTITLNAANGPLVLSKDLTICGPGAACLTVSGNDATQVFCVASGATDTITGLTIADGKAVGGGGILNEGTLRIDHCTLCGNSADGGNGGGAIFNDGQLTLQDSTLSDNHADGDVNGGGGILNDVQGQVTLQGCTLSGNHADCDGNGGGGIFNNGGTLTVDHSTLSGNHADDENEVGGGGIYNDAGGTARVANTTLSGNTADDNAEGGGGGGIFNAAVLTLEDCTLSGNHADGCFFGGGAVLNGGDLALDYSTLLGNFSPVGADLNNAGGSVSLNHSTVGVRADG
jgi:hypothetical protein